MQNVAAHFSTTRFLTKLAPQMFPTSRRDSDKPLGLVPRDEFSFARMAEFCFALAMRAVPRTHRFDAAILVAPTFIPLLRWTKSYREQHRMGFHSHREIALYLLLNALTKNRTAFDPSFVVDGYNHLEQARKTSKGVLVIGHHAALTVLMVRFFHDKGLDPVVITPDSGLRVPGTLTPARTVLPSPMFLVQLRSRLRHGELVCAMPDRAEHHTGGRTKEFTTPTGQIIVAPAMIEVASRCGAEVLFTEAKLSGRQLAVKIVAPTQNASSFAEVVNEFISFVRACTGKRVGVQTNQIPTHEQDNSAYPVFARR